MNVILILPILIPLSTAIISLLLRRWRVAQRILGVAGTFALLGSAIALLVTIQANGIQAVQIGNWPAPFGITLVADLFSSVMVVLTGLMGLAVAVYSLVTVDRRRESFGYYPLLNILLMGVCGAFLTGDLFNLYVWFELMLIASFVLVTLGGERPQMEGAIHYVTLNLISSGFFLVAVGVLYGITGTLNMADLALTIRNGVAHELVTPVAMLFLVAFGIKAAVFPVFFWLPASYHTPPVAVSAIFAALLTKVGVYAMIRTFTLIFTHDVGFTHTLLLVVAGLTMITGVFGAVSQNEFRRILSFHIISQIGYMLMGLAIYTPFALAGSVFYIIHHIIVKTNLFLISGQVLRLTGTFQLKALGGLYRTYPLLGVLFLIPAMSLAGLPPLSGFFAKLSLVEAGLRTEHYVIVAVALFVSPLTLLSMTKIWTEAFWKAPPDELPLPSGPRADGSAGPASRRQRRGWSWAMVVPMVVLASITVAIGLSAEAVFSFSQLAANQLMDSSGYIQAVLGSRA